MVELRCFDLPLSSSSRVFVRKSNRYDRTRAQQSSRHDVPHLQEQKPSQVLHIVSWTLLCAWTGCFDLSTRTAVHKHTTKTEMHRHDIPTGIMSQGERDCWIPPLLANSSHRDCFNPGREKKGRRECLSRQKKLQKGAGLSNPGEVV